MSLQVTINEQKQDLPEGLTVAGMLVQFAVETKGIAVVINEEIIPKGSYDSTVLQAGDQIEILTFAGGG